MNKFYYCIFLFLIALVSFSQPPTSPEVFVEINSGNPAFPFPQFLKYESAVHSLGNLASTNAPGVVHAEMEQSIRDAWQIMANRFSYSGTTHSGVKYIRPNWGCPYDCTEGSGYGMLAAAEMADKTTFDGVWFRTHDEKMVKQPRYSDCIVPNPGYPYGEFSIVDNGDSAADGDVDIALGLLVAYKQWGEDSGYQDGCGNVINYKEEALKVIRGLVERTDRMLSPGDCRRVSGIIGYDGYMKGGNTWGQLTPWFSAAGGECPEFGGSRDQHIDYFSPSYFKAFVDFLTDNADARDQGWNIDQFKRAEASSDWLMGKMLDDPNTLPLAGWVSLDDANNPTYSNYLDGEDFRNPWRTVLNYVWHGDPSDTWNPTTHQVEPGGNSFEQNIGKRLAKFMKDPGAAPYSNPCSSVGGGPALTYSGPSQLKYYYNPLTGAENTTFNLNWLAGTGSPAAIAAQDFDLMGKLYRQCEIEWDTTSAGDGYLTSVPGYFHGFFRLLGMLTLSGNHQSPAEAKLEANMKVYHSVNKTFAFAGDELEYTIDYRNYASVDANNVVITTTLPKGLSFVSASNGGSAAGQNVTWSIGNVLGLKTATGITPTQGQVTLKVEITNDAPDRICNEFKIEASNGKGWTSNEYPNNVTPVMERNCVDIAIKALEIDKTANHSQVNVGDEVIYDINFENASSGGFLNGGRPGVIPAYAHSGHAGSSNQSWMKLRLYHGADEAYIDYGNYRISLFLNDNAIDCVAGTPGCAGLGWALDSAIYEGGDASKVSITSETIVPGSDANGAWNQRIIVKFSEQLATITPHVSRYFGLAGGRVHRGGAQPLRAVWQMHNSAWSDIQWDDDWSWNPTFNDADGGLYFPVTNDWTDPDNPDIPVTEYHNEACEKPTKTIDNILIEEWDGFTWRRVFGNSPVPGREVEDVVLIDKLPAGFKFVGFVDNAGTDLGASVSILGETASYDAATHSITWKKSGLQVKEKGGFRYKTTAGFSSGSCPRADEIAINTVSIEAKNESPLEKTSEVTVTCAAVILPPPPSSMTKTVTPVSAKVGENVNYTLSYENTDGADFDSDFTEKWTAQSGAAMALAASGVTSSSGVAAVFTNDFSHGTDGDIEASVNFADFQAFGFALRHTGGAIDNGVYVVFKQNSGAGNIEAKVFNGTTELKSTTLTLAGTPINLKLQLQGDQLQVWVGNTTTPSPTWSVTGVNVQAGYTGVINGFPDGSDTFGSHNLTAFRSHMDSAFNLQLTDPIPSEITFVSATDSGVVNSGILTYPVVTGPILVGEIISYSWEGTIASCSSVNSKIVNIAYTNGLGLPKDTVSAQAILDCSGANPCVVPVSEPTVSISTFCVGATAPTDIDAFVTATETIVWYADATSTAAISKPTIDTSVANTTSYYVVQKTAANCESNRVKVDVVVDDIIKGGREVKTIQSGDAVDFDNVAEFTLTAGSISFQATDNANISGESTTSTTSDSILDVLINNSSVSETVTYIITSSSSACPIEPSELEVTILPTPVTAISAVISGSKVVEGDDLIFEVKLSEIATTDIEVTFTSVDISTLPTDYNLVNTSIIIPAGTDEGNYIITTIDDTDVENLETLEVTIVDVDGKPNPATSSALGEIEDNDTACPVIDKPLVANTEFCIGDTVADIETFITASNTIVWYADAVVATPMSSKPIIDTSIETTIIYYVSQQTAAGCESDREQVAVDIKKGDPGQFEAKTIVNNTSVDFNVAAEMGLETGRINWEAIPNNDITGESAVNTTADVIADVLVNTTTTAQVVTYTITSNPLTGCAPESSQLEVTVLPMSTVLTAIINNGSTTIEGGNLIFPISITNAVATDVEITFAINSLTALPSDYINRNLSIIIPAGATTGDFILETLDDFIEENDETLELEIGNINGNPNPISQSAIGTIQDNDGPVACTTITAPLVTGVSLCFGSSPVAAIETYVSATETLVWYADETSTTSIPKPTIDVDTAGSITYFVSQKDAANCESTRSALTITIADERIPEFDTIEIESGTSVNYDVSANMGFLINRFSWIVTNDVAFVEGESTINATTNIITDILVNTSDQVQTVEYDIIESGVECPSSTSSRLIVQVKPPKDRGYPLFFTPNGDSENDYWEVSAKTSDLINYIEIYDRYGKLLASIKPVDRWNGTYNDLHMPADDYWFVSNLKDGKQETGHFSLIR